MAHEKRAQSCRTSGQSGRRPEHNREPKLVIHEFHKLKFGSNLHPTLSKRRLAPSLHHLPIQHKLAINLTRLDTPCLLYTSPSPRDGLLS
eukprot:6190066-Pleurochrysis_carterae.AAC.4